MEILQYYLATLGKSKAKNQGPCMEPGHGMEIPYVFLIIHGNSISFLINQIS